MSEVFQAGATSKTVYALFRDATTMDGKTGLLYSTSGLKVYYTRSRAAAVVVTKVTQTVTGAWASGGFVEVDAANAPGLYRIDLPDAAIAAGVNDVKVCWSGTGVLADGLEIALVGFDPTTIDKAGYALSAAGLNSVVGYTP